MNLPKKQKATLVTFALCAVAAGAFFVLYTSSNKNKINSAAIEVLPETVAEHAANVPLDVSFTPPAPEVPAYTSYKVLTTKPGPEIAQQVGLKNLPFVLAFNRLDVTHIQQGVVLAIPDQFTNWDALSPFPKKLDIADDIPKLILISQRVQAFGAYESGKLVRWGPVSSGKEETPTPSKLYTTNWKGKLVVSTLEGGYILPWAFNLDSMGGIAMHQFDLPGFPASHACVRLLAADAEWIYNWADQWILSPDEQTELASGTPVLVFGEYAYKKTAPWKKLPTDAAASTLTEEELEKAINPELATIKAKQEKRSEVEGKNS